MKRVIYASILGAGALGAIVYVARPEIIEKQYREAKAPIERVIEERRAAKYAAAKELAYTAWAQKLPPMPDCENTRTSLKALECKNKQDINNAAFEKAWRQKLASGWEPD